MQPVVAKLRELRATFDCMVARVEEVNREHTGYKDLHARRLVESAGHIIITYLLAREAGEAEEYGSDAKLFLKMAEAYIAAASTVITNSEGSDVDLIHEVDEAC